MTLAFTDRDLLEVWAATRGRGSAQRAASLLERALPAERREAVATWPLARRNSALLELRISRWGSGLEGTASCPGCEEELELSLDLEALRRARARHEPSLRVETGEGPIDFRMPTGDDLEVVASIEDPGAARRALAERCAVTTPAGPSRIPEEAIAQMSEQMSEADPVGALVLELQCSECGSRWHEGLDLGEFIAAEAGADARRIAAEVHALASAYGWSESDILVLPPERRRLYLELVEG